jgi:hypothetical protein
MWCVPTLDTEYIQRMDDVLALYERPYDAREPVICLDERPTPLHGEKRAAKLATPGKPRRFDYEYVRKGTANIFSAVEPRAGKHMTKVTETRDAIEFAKFLGELARRYRNAATIHLVMDNLSTHTEKSLTRHYGDEKGRKLWARFTKHYTPKHASWLNQAEIELGLLTRQALGKRRFDTIEALRDQVTAWERRANHARLKINWRFSRKQARKVFRLRPTETKRSQH